MIAKQIAFNCVPQIDVFLDNGYTKEEMKMFWETQKIMEDPTIRVNATAVRVRCSSDTRKPCTSRRGASSPRRRRARSCAGRRAWW